MSTDVGDSMTSVKGFFYISDFVCNNTTEDLQSPTTRDLFSWIYRQAEAAVISSSSSSTPPPPKHCDCVCERLHPILYLCNVETLVMVSNDAHRWHRPAVDPQGFSVRSHQTCSDSVGDVRLMYFLQNPSRLQFSVVQNVVVISPVCHWEDL